MDIRIGAKSPVYSARTTSKLSDPALKSSFAKMMAETKPVNQDTVEISGNPLAKRLEGVHQKIDEMDFAGKSSEEVYKSIVDIYDEEFGFLGNLAYSDYDSYVEVLADKRDVLQKTVPCYELRNEKELHYRAMGYDRMTKEEKIVAISERVGGNSYIHKYAMLGEMERAGVITSQQSSTIAHSLRRKSEKEYCAAHGLDYMRWKYPSEYGDDYSERAMKLKEKSLAAWASTVDVTWLEVFDSVHEDEALRDYEKNALMKELEGTSELLIGSDKVW